MKKLTTQLSNKGINVFLNNEIETDFITCLGDFNVYVMMSGVCSCGMILWSKYGDCNQNWLECITLNE